MYTNDEAIEGVLAPGRRRARPPPRKEPSRGDERTRSMVRGFVDMFYLMSKSLLYGRLGNTQ